MRSTTPDAGVVLILFDTRLGQAHTLFMPATRTALLACSFASSALVAAFPVDAVATACATARTLADAGHVVTLSWTANTIDDKGGGVVLAAVAVFLGDARFSGRVAAYRLLRNPMGELVAWLEIASGKPGRGYLVSYYPAEQRLAVSSGAPTDGLYMWGQTRLRAVQPCEGAEIVRDWTQLA